jgi:hypothetical protein
MRSRDPSAETEYSFSLASPHRTFPQRLSSTCAGTATSNSSTTSRFKVEDRSRFFYPVRPPDERRALDSAVRVAVDIVEERLVLVAPCDSSNSGADTCHATTDELAGLRGSGIVWVRSWRGSRDEGEV